MEEQSTGVPRAPRHEIQPQRSRRESRAAARKKARKRRSTLTIITIIFLIFALLGAAIYMVYKWRSNVAADYEGSGSTSQSVQVTVLEGMIGSDIAQVLKKADVIASSKSFYELCLAKQEQCGKIQPGTYNLNLKMSAASAMAMLLDKSNRVDNQITLGPGLTKYQVSEQMQKKGGFSAEQIESAYARAQELGLPPEAKGDVEGWLAPGSYLAAPGTTADDLIKKMIAGSVKRLKDANIPESKWQEFLIMASIVQKEGTDLQPDDYAKIARVVLNRTKPDMETHGYLNMDSTVLYGVTKDATSRRLPTVAEINDEANAYNTYRHKGLPPGPIGLVGDYAFEGMTNPANGNWLYFTTVNLSTGETRFADTIAEHKENIELLKTFCTENPGKCSDN